MKPGKTRQYCFCIRAFKIIPGLRKGSQYGMPSVGIGIFSRRATLWPGGRDLGVCLIPHSWLSLGQVFHKQQGRPQILTNQNQTVSFVTKSGTKAKSLQVKLPHKIVRKVSKTLLKILKKNYILLRIIGHGHDMVANDACYPPSCMNAFKAAHIPTQVSKGVTL